MDTKVSGGHGNHEIMHYAPVYQSLNNGHLRLLELLLGVTTSRVGEVDGMADLDVIGEGDVLDFDTRVNRHEHDLSVSGLRHMLSKDMYTLLGIPLSEELDLRAEF